MKQIAIIAPTASGKTALSIEIAQKTNSVILSLDSLSIYKEIDIASAKPTIQERAGIVHFGVDEVYPNEQFDVMQFIELYQSTKEYAKSHEKNIIIVGGTGFYLKGLLDGISCVPKITAETLAIVQNKLLDLPSAYQELVLIDKEYSQKIKSNDKYRIEKALNIYFETSQKPTDFFAQNKPVPFIEDLQIFEIMWDADSLRDRIKQRTKIMLDDGLIDEVIYLEKKYQRAISPMGAIGIKESLEYLDGKIDKKTLEEKITIATSQLAKRQRTFNKGQFKDVHRDSLQNLYAKTMNKQPLNKI